MSSVRFDYLPPLHGEPRVRARTGGFEVVWRTTCGWRCRCGKTGSGRLCRHVRAVVRALPAPVASAVAEHCQRLGWST